VGGDLYDILPIGPRHLMFVVADVAGKGASAGLTMARAFGLIRAASTSRTGAARCPTPATCWP
jgi:serine phosphatase RsbU (regulator of sigma subunit)